MRNIYLIGRNFNNQVGGPASIIRGLVKGLNENNVPVHEVCLSETFGKVSLIKTLFKILLTKKRCIINVHTDGLKLPNLVYWFSKFDRKNDYYLTVHGLYSIDAKMNGNHKKKYDKIERKLCKKFPKIICVSKLLEETIKLNYHRKKWTCVVPNGIDVDELVENSKKQSNNHAIKAVMLGGIRSCKGIFESLELVNYLNKNNIPTTLSVYGNISNAESYKQYEGAVARLGLNGLVEYKNCLTKKSDVYQVIADSDIQFCLSKWDTFNVAIIESLAIGVPCIASNQCGASSAITDGVNGCVLDLSDENFMTKAKEFILNLETDENRLKRIVQLSSTIIEQYSWKNVSKLYLSAINYDIGE